MELARIPQAIEAVLFVAGEPVAIQELAKALEISEMELMSVLDKMETETENRGIVLKRYGDHVRLETKAEFSPQIESLLNPVQRQSLSQSIMETLAVIAYRQPVTRGDIEQIRGVKCDYSVQSLLSKGLIKEVGRKESLGHPILYATTDDFLKHFGISDIRELPPLTDSLKEALPEQDL